MAGFVEIPGFREAVKREQRVRRQAWTSAHSLICGVRVRALTLRDLETLEEMGNGFFAPWRFDTELEYLAHCAQLVWWLSSVRKPGPDAGLWRTHRCLVARRRLNARLAAEPARLANETRAFLEEQFFDAPKGHSGMPTTPAAAGAAYLIDAIAAGGYGLDPETVLDLPLPRLWQLVRMVQRRVFGQPLTNPSDKLATDYLAGLAQPARN